MAKGKTATVFFCQNCGYESTKWLGQCPGCREWNTFVEETIDKTVLKNTGTGSRRERREASEPCVLSEIAIREENKTLTGIKELDRVLGGGIVQGSLTLVGGDPGIGKSTLLLQVCHNLSEAGHKVLYISGEESKVQIKMRADRLGTFSEHMLLLCETNLDIIGEVIRRSKPEVVIIDSIQTMYNENVSAAPGSVSQVRESTGILLQLAKGLGISIFIVGHVTKEGTVAGPRVLEHMSRCISAVLLPAHVWCAQYTGLQSPLPSYRPLLCYDISSQIPDFLSPYRHHRPKSADIPDIPDSCTIYPSVCPWRCLN